MLKAIVLGGTIPHIELIKRLKKIGYFVILVDYTTNPPAKKIADVHLQVSTLDKASVLKIAQKESVDLVISSCIDHANCVACYVGERLGLPIPYSYNTALNSTKKDLMKKIFKENGIPTAEYYVLDSDDGKPPRIDYPIVIKPVDSNSSKGVFRITSDDDFHLRIKESFSFSIDKKVIVEKCISGIEIEAICIAINKRSHLLFTREFTSLNTNGKELQTSGTSVPGVVCEGCREKLEIIAQKIVDAFGLDNTPFFLQAFYNEDGIHVIEFATRIAGGATYEMVNRIVGFDYLDASIRSFLHLPIAFVKKDNNRKYLNLFLYMHPGIYSHVDGLDNLLKTGLVDMWFPYYYSGKEINSNMSTNNRIGSIMVSGNTYEEAEMKLQVVQQSISVIDVNGRDVSYWK